MSPRPVGLPAHSLAEVAARLGVPVRGADPSRLERPVLTGVALDTRAILPGDLWAATAGSLTHGAEFATTAAAAGACACLTDPAGAARALAAGLPTYVVPAPREVLGGLAAWVYGDPAGRLSMFGITGTNGKTTTAYLLEAGLRSAGRSTGLIGTIETRIGAEALPSVRTTPEAPDLQALLAVMVQRGVDAVAMEVSSHALAMGRVDGTTYDVAMFTNLSPDHLDFHADMEEYFAVKASLFTRQRSRLGVIDVDDHYGARLATMASAAGLPVVTLSPAGDRADWQVERFELEASGSRFVLVGPDGVRLPCWTALAGAVNVANAALAVVGLVLAGIGPEQAALGVATCPGVPGRMERVEAPPEGPLALVDFAHSPDSLERLLTAARGLTGPGGRVLAVLGAGGDRDRHKRPLMGEIAVRGADLVVLTSDNPRSEDPMAIIEALHSGARDAQVPGAAARVRVEPDRRAAIALAVVAAGPGDVLVVAGKGHEQGQEIDGVVHPFDDRAVLAEALASPR